MLGNITYPYQLVFQKRIIIIQIKILANLWWVRGIRLALADIRGRCCRCWSFYGRSCEGPICVPRVNVYVWTIVRGRTCFEPGRFKENDLEEFTRISVYVLEQYSALQIRRIFSKSDRSEIIEIASVPIRICIKYIRYIRSEFLYSSLYAYSWVLSTHVSLFNIDDVYRLY